MGADKMDDNKETKDPSVKPEEEQKDEKKDGVQEEENVSKTEKSSESEQTSKPEEPSVKEEKKQAQSGGAFAGIGALMSSKSILMIAALVVVAIMGIKSLVTSSSSSTQTCEVVPQSPFGNSQQQTWYEAKSEPEAKAVGGYDIEYPDSVDGNDTKKYVALTKQVMEVRYYDGDTETARITKAYICGNQVFSFLYVDETKYTSTNVVKVGDLEVTERGDGNTVSTAEWVDGDYSYSIGTWNDPLTKDEIEALIEDID
jgi:hypothetical protein